MKNWFIGLLVSVVLIITLFLVVSNITNKNKSDTYSLQLHYKDSLYQVSQDKIDSIKLEYNSIKIYVDSLEQRDTIFKLNTKIIWKENEETHVIMDAANLDQLNKYFTDSISTWDTIW